MTISDIHGWFDYADLYREAIKRCRRGGTLVELGVWCGKSLAFLAQESINQGRTDIKLFGIDLWNFDIEISGWDGYEPHEKMFKQLSGGKGVKELCEWNFKELGLSDRVTLIQSDTIAAAERFQDASVDFVWFDSNHDERHVKNEIQAWLPKFRRPTWCGGHDVQSPGLWDAVRCHFPDAKKVIEQHMQHGSWRAELP